MANSNQQHNHSQLFEGLEAGDLARLIDSRVTVDEYKSKIGSDEDTVVITFKVQGKNPALDLVGFIEKSYDWVLDADSSSGELDDGTYLVFVEADREPVLADNLITMFEDVCRLVDLEMDEWRVVYHKPTQEVGATVEELSDMIPLTRDDYLAKHRDMTEQLDKLKTAAGVRVETRAPKNDFTESLRIAAGIR